ncbi:hypothetical protein BKA69DRAFT_1123087 [Paraphysoderma sedebokerense]|nr:hypothetical protein BKA69DRAFT_1123087 [Paraphysoderma sedebokerense]
MTISSSSSTDPGPANMYDDPIVTYVFVLTLINIYILVTTLLFISKTRSLVIHKRGYQITVISVLCNLLVFNFHDVFNILHSMNCLLVIGIQYIFLPLFSFCYVLRIFYIISVYYINQSATSPSIEEDSKPSAIQSLWRRHIQRLSRILVRSDSNRHSPACPPREIHLLSVGTSVNMKNVFKIILVFFIFEVMVLVATIVTSKNRFLANPRITLGECDQKHDIIYGFLGYYALLLSTIVFALWELKKVKDSYYVKAEIVSCLVISGIGFAIYFICYFLPPTSSAAYHSYVPSAITLLICHSLSVTAPMILAFRHDRHIERASVDNEKISFDRVLSNPALFQEFKVQLAKDFSIENGFFYEDYLEFCTLYSSSSSTSILPRSLSQGKLLSASSSKTSLSPSSLYTPAVLSKLYKIYRTYIAPEAPMELNVDGKLRKMAQQSVNETGVLSIEVLDNIKEEVKKNMMLNSFPKFIKDYKLP